MIPYADFLYFGVLLYVLVPTLLLGLAGRPIRWWIVAASVVMLAVQYSGLLRIEAGIEVREIWVLAGYAAFEWIAARGFLQLRRRTNRRWVFAAALLVALSPMVVAKYVPLVAPHFRLGFLGISYVTLRAVDVIICTQDRLITALPPVQFFAYLFFFGTISSGPIDRYRRFGTDWAHRRTRAEFTADLDGAVQRLFTGFLYKFILAALIERYWLDPAAARAGVAATLSYMYAYSFYLFFDFAGYSAFAIAVSYLFGIHTPENFDRPFLARNIRDFWNRWNITLSSWLRDHIYMRFVMAALKGRWFRSPHVASYVGLFLAFGLMGVWHGTALHYVLYGAYHGALLSAHEAFSRWNKSRQLWGSGRAWQAAGVFGTFQCVCFGFLLFSGHLTGSGDPLRTAGDGAMAYEGRFEKASCDEIGGWVRDRHRPAAPVRVDIVADGTPVATIDADLVRHDLLDGSPDSAAHGFVYVPPPALKDGWRHEISVRVADTDVSLDGPPRSIICALHGTSMDGYDGAHDGTSCEQITGWAADMTAPEGTIEVAVYDGATPLGVTRADQGRGDGAATDWHGFAFAIPAQLRDGRPHSISVRIAATGGVLRNSPQLLMCSADGTTTVPTPTPPPPRPGAAPAAGTTAAPPSYRDNRDGTITALHTGLMWEKKIRLDGAGDAANPHDADNCYPWFGRCAGDGAQCRVDADCGGGRCTAADCQTPAPDGMTIFAWVARLNASRFAGYDDWRLPSSSELYGVVDPLEAGDAATRAAFTGASCGTPCDALSDPACSCTHPGLYWAAPRSGPSPDDSWMMFFYCNGNLFLDLEGNKFHVRAVRGGESANLP